MNNKCLDCGKVFHYKDTEIVQRVTGVFNGAKSYAKYCVCPYCGGDYEAAHQCWECGEWFLECELDDDDLCENCRADDED